MSQPFRLAVVAAVTASALVVIVLTPGCSKPEGYRPINPDSVLFWDRQVTESAHLLQLLADEFNKGRDGLPVKVEYSGGYSEIFRKVSTSIQAGTVPAMAVAYQSMTTAYIEAGAVLALDDYLRDPQIGLSENDVADFFPVVLDTNRYPDYGGKMYSFPFCKSVLMMYFNKRVLAEAGVSAPPKTWDEFLDACRQVKAKTGKSACAVSVDASTIDGMIFSLGADVLDGKTTLFDSPQSIRVFELFETLAREQLAYQIPPNSYDDRDAFARDEVAFVFRSSSHRAPIALLMKDPAQWGMSMTPQGDPERPCTVLYGPNICIFSTTPEQQAVAWEFVKFFTSPDVSVRWALGTGYVPIRKSAAENATMQAFWAEWEYNRAAFDCLSFAKSEPMVVGWQEVRDLVEKAQTAVLTGVKTGKEAALELKREADAVLQKRG